MPASVRVQPGEALAGAGTDSATNAPDTTQRRLIQRAVRAALRREHVTDAEISITLLDDNEIAAMNRQFLDHEGPTDVISFPLYEEGGVPVGDIYIGYEQALRQAGVNGVSAREELVRLVVHGVLHVLGHDHPAGKARMQSGMWQLQESIVAQVLAS